MYSVFNNSDINMIMPYDEIGLGEVHLPAHPLMNGVNTFSGGYYSYRTDATADDLQEGVELVASWSDGSPLIMVKETDNFKLVQLGFNPVSSDYSWGLWDSSTDGMNIISNALNYVAGGLKGTEVDWVTLSSYESDLLEPGSPHTITVDYSTVLEEEGWQTARITAFGGDSRQAFPDTFLEIFVDATSDLIAADTLDFGEITVGSELAKSFNLLNQGNGSAQYVITGDTLGVIMDGLYDTLLIGSNSTRLHQLSLMVKEVGELHEKVLIHNLTDEQEAIEVVLRAEIKSPGIIRITPELVDVEVAYQGETNGIFMLHNDSEADLDFEFSAFHLQGLSEPIAPVVRMDNEQVPSKLETDNRIGGPALDGIGEDSYGYIFVDSEEEEGPSYIWNDISTAGESLTLADDGMHRIELPFEFPIYGIMKKEVYISANGLLSFDEKAGNPINTQLPSGSAPNGIIAAFWKDLNPGLGGQIHYVLNDDQLIVQYSEVPDYEESGVFTFQIKILSSGDIFFYYKEMTGKINDATLGIEDLTGSKGLQVAFNTEYITDGLAVEILHPELRILPAFSSGSIAAGDSLEVPFLYHPLDDLGGYHMDQLLVASNDTINPTSQVFIHSWVEGPANIAAEKDTLLMDTTYIDQYDFARNFYRNDNVGVLKIDSIKSSSDQFAVMMPRYQVLIDEDGVQANLEYENITRYLNGEITGIVDPLEIKLVTRNQDGTKVVQDINFYTPNDSVISINTTIEWGLSIDWGFAQEEMYLEVYTEQQLSGAISERFVPVQDWIYHNSTSGNVRVLYRPTRVETDTAQIVAYSNALESTEMSFTAIGTGKSSAASISINVRELKEHLVVNDSSEQAFEISNVGTDSLYLSLRKKRFEFESNYQPIVVEEFDETVLTTNDGSMKWRAPQDETLENSHSDNSARILEEPLYDGVFYGTLSAGFDTYLGYGELGSPEELSIEKSIWSGPFYLGAEYLYGSSTELLLLGSGGELFLYDFNDQTSLRIATLEGDSDWTGLATDPKTGELYGVTLTSLFKIDQYSFETDHIGLIGFDWVIGLAINNESEIYAYTLDNEFLSIDVSTGAGTYIGDIGFNANYGQDMAYDLSNDAIFMASYSSSYGGQLRIVNEETGATEVIGQLATNMPNDQVSSIAFPMVGNSYGLSLNVRDTVLAPGQSLEVIAGFNSKGLMNGTYRSEVTITSNDYSHPQVEIPVELLVSGNDPAVGDYDKIINFGMTTLYDTLSAEWTVWNDGMEVLILNLEELGNGFVLQDSTQDSVRIDVGSSKRIGFYFIPEEADTYEFKSKWRTNDPNNELIAVTLSGAGQRSETHLEMDQMQLVFEGVRGVTIDQAINFYSMGSDTVVYDFRLGDETVSWISLERDSTSLAPDSTRQSVIQVNTTDLEVGTYESYLVLTSNDPYYDSLTLPVTLEVFNQDLIVEQAFELQVLAIEEDTLRYDLSTFFSDPDLDELSYVVSTANGLAGFELLESNLAIWGETAGEDQVVVRATDGNGSEAEVQIPLLLNDRPIVTTALENQIVTLGHDFVTAFEIMDHFEDVDALSVDIEATEMAAIQVSDDLMVSIKGLQAGQVELMVTVSDGNHEVSQVLNLTINSPVVVDRSFEQQLLAIEEDTLRLDLTSFFSDADADDLSYEVTQLNEHSGFEVEGTQLIIWGESTGESQVMVHASDGKGGTGEVAIPLMMNHRPVVSNPFASYYLTIGDSFQPSLMLGDYFEDVDGQDLTVAIDSSDFVHFVISENMQLLIKGLQVGNDTVTVTVSDGYHEVNQSLILVINEELLKLYPNPAIDFFTVNFPIEIDDQLEFRLIDMGGVIVKSWDVNPTDENSVKLGVLGVESGLYFLEIFQGEERLSQERIMIK
ncbi:T9SS type A sorting domain-containing protein [Reichenbachiella ulvae]|uniref:T9SS type A sorting domain-containing protein n=1 Tax=Reichenbachiella ulvae TaxID=2980104 RepID=A0ABT3CTL4_9BACT|nr:T9SS type A sorting domain-containing protein [Reichenbachiella ulvae]MCV9386578.1 T9SS type A sorting domain-containing protein [Reichenbachiella ulvae]